MKNTHIIALAAFILTAGASGASAQNLAATIYGDTDADVRIGKTINADANARVDIRASTSKDREDIEDDDDRSTSSIRENDEDGDEDARTEHKNTVSTFVRSLLDVADREGGIGAQVREIARSQNDSASTTVSAMADIDNRSGLRTFFFGSNYTNLGKIRSEIATTSNNIARLKALLNQGTLTATDTAEINAEIKALETAQTRVQAYVDANENIFSLFGWFKKLFVK